MISSKNNLKDSVLINNLRSKKLRMSCGYPCRNVVMVQAWQVVTLFGTLSPVGPKPGFYSNRIELLDITD